MEQSYEHLSNKLFLNTTKVFLAYEKNSGNLGVQLLAIFATN